MKVHMHTQFCLICLLTFIFHHCDHCHGYVHDHTSEESHSHNDYQISEDPYLKNEAQDWSMTKSVLSEAEHEQKYYIEKLFHHYGDNGRLSYNGLEKLLKSLGLGEVKVVEMDHEDMGHDPVSHLDILDVQEGKHLHIHDHIDSHSQPDVENVTKSTVSTTELSNCKEKIAKESLPVEHKKHHNHHLHHKPHNGTYHSHTTHHHNHSNNHTDSHNHVEDGEETNEQFISTNKTHHPEKKTHKQKQKGTKNIDITIGPEFVFQQSEDEHKHVSKPEHNMDVTPFIDRGNSHVFESEEHRQVSRKGQRNTTKREAPNDHIHTKKQSSIPHNHKQHNGRIHEHDECLNVTELLHYFGLNINSPISQDQFSYLCPALLYQIHSGSCIKHFTDLQVENVTNNKGGASAWICGFISITVISLLSLLGVILIPIINQGCFKFLLNFLVALAVGTLSGDALLHLLPHSQGGHDHGSKETDHINDLGPAEDEDFLVEYDSVMKGLVALGGIYLLFIVEHCLRMFKHYKERRGRPNKLNRKQNVDESTVGKASSDQKINRRSDVEWLQLKPLAGAEDPTAIEGQHLNETEMTYIDSIHQSPVKVFVPVDVLPQNNKDGSFDDDHSIGDGQYDQSYEKANKPNHFKHSKHSHHSHGHCHSGKDLKDTGISSIAWMVIMGDGMHNFSDGLAIGAAFSAGLTGGISTSVAVFCHELPHELGDFAVLLKAGMTVKQAIVYNLLSAMMAYIGMLIGTAVGQYANNITLWIFAITAGMFLYVALVDMLPEMLHGDGENEEHGHCPVGHFILQNLGLLLGFAIMLVIALYEDKIVFDINF